MFISICILAFMGCAKNSEFNSVPGLPYDLKITILDEPGNDLLDSLPLMDSEEWAAFAYVLDSTAYDLRIEGGDSTLFRKPLALEKGAERTNYASEPTPAPGRDSYRPSGTDELGSYLSTIVVEG